MDAIGMHALLLHSLILDSINQQVEVKILISFKISPNDSFEVLIPLKKDDGHSNTKMTYIPSYWATYSELPLSKDQFITQPLIFEIWLLKSSTLKLSSHTLPDTQQPDQKILLGIAKYNMNIQYNEFIRIPITIIYMKKEIKAMKSCINNNGIHDNIDDDLDSMLYFSFYTAENRNILNKKVNQSIQCFQQTITTSLIHQIYRPIKTCDGPVVQQLSHIKNNVDKIILPTADVNDANIPGNTDIATIISKRDPIQIESKSSNVNSKDDNKLRESVTSLLTIDSLDQPTLHISNNNNHDYDGDDYKKSDSDYDDVNIRKRLQNSHYKSDDFKTSTAVGNIDSYHDIQPRVSKELSDPSIGTSTGSGTNANNAIHERNEIATVHSLDITITNTLSWSLFQEAFHSSSTSSSSSSSFSSSMAFHGNPGIDYSNTGCYLHMTMPNILLHPTDNAILTQPQQQQQQQRQQQQQQQQMNIDISSVEYQLWWDAEYPILNGRQRIKYIIPPSSTISSLSSSSSSSSSSSLLYQLFETYLKCAEKESDDHIHNMTSAGIVLYFQYCDDDYKPLSYTSHTSVDDDKLESKYFGYTVLTMTQLHEVFTSHGGTFQYNLPVFPVDSSLTFSYCMEEYHANPTKSWPIISLTLSYLIESNFLRRSLTNNRLPTTPTVPTTPTNPISDDISSKVSNTNLPSNNSLLISQLHKRERPQTSGSTRSTTPNDTRIYKKQIRTLDSTDIHINNNNRGIRQEEDDELQKTFPSLALLLKSHDKLKSTTVHSKDTTDNTRSTGIHFDSNRESRDLYPDSTSTTLNEIHTQQGDRLIDILVSNDQSSRSCTTKKEETSSSSSKMSIQIDEIRHFEYEKKNITNKKLEGSCQVYCAVELCANNNYMHEIKGDLQTQDTKPTYPYMYYYTNYNPRQGSMSTHTTNMKPLSHHIIWTHTSGHTETATTITTTTATASSSHNATSNNRLADRESHSNRIKSSMSVQSYNTIVLPWSSSEYVSNSDDSIINILSIPRNPTITHILISIYGRDMNLLSSIRNESSLASTTDNEVNIGTQIEADGRSAVASLPSPYIDDITPAVPRLTDKLLGTVVIDLGIIHKGIHEISGWYHIVNSKQDICGQLFATINILRDEGSALTTDKVALDCIQSSSSHKDEDYIAKWHTSPPPSVATSTNSPTQHNLVQDIERTASNASEEIFCSVSLLRAEDIQVLHKLRTSLDSLQYTLEAQLQCAENPTIHKNEIGKTCNADGVKNEYRIEELVDVNTLNSNNRIDLNKTDLTIRPNISPPYSVTHSNVSNHHDSNIHNNHNDLKDKLGNALKMDPKVLSNQAVCKSDINSCTQSYVSEPVSLDDNTHIGFITDQKDTSDKNTDHSTLDKVSVHDHIHDDDIDITDVNYSFIGYISPNTTTTNALLDESLDDWEQVATLNLQEIQTSSTTSPTHKVHYIQKRLSSHDLTTDFHKDDTSDEHQISHSLEDEDSIEKARGTEYIIPDTSNHDTNTYDDLLHQEDYNMIHTSTQSDENIIYDDVDNPMSPYYLPQLHSITHDNYLSSNESSQDEGDDHYEHSYSSMYENTLGSTDILPEIDIRDTYISHGSDHYGPPERDIETTIHDKFPISSEYTDRDHDPKHLKDTIDAYVYDEKVRKDSNISNEDQNVCGDNDDYMNEAGESSGMSDYYDENLEFKGSNQNDKGEDMSRDGNEDHFHSSNVTSLLHVANEIQDRRLDDMLDTLLILEDYDNDGDHNRDVEEHLDERQNSEIYVSRNDDNKRWEEHNVNMPSNMNLSGHICSTNVINNDDDKDIKSSVDGIHIVHDDEKDVKEYETDINIHEIQSDIKDVKDVNVPLHDLSGKDISNQTISNDLYRDMMEPLHEKDFIIREEDITSSNRIISEDILLLDSAIYGYPSDGNLRDSNVINTIDESDRVTNASISDVIIDTHGFSIDTISNSHSQRIPIIRSMISENHQAHPLACDMIPLERHSSISSIRKEYQLNSTENNNDTNQKVIKFSPTTYDKAFITSQVVSTSSIPTTTASTASTAASTATTTASTGTAVVDVTLESPMVSPPILPSSRVITMKPSDTTYTLPTEHPSTIMTTQAMPSSSIKMIETTPIDTIYHPISTSYSSIHQSISIAETTPPPPPPAGSLGLNNENNQLKLDTKKLPSEESSSVPDIVNLVHKVLSKYNYVKSKKYSVSSSHSTTMSPTGTSPSTDYKSTSESRREYFSRKNYSIQKQKMFLDKETERISNIMLRTQVLK